jgi:transposase
LPGQALDRDVPADHLARVIDQAVDRLDLTDLYAAYAGTGSLAHPPALLLQALRYELPSGRRRPAPWYQDATESQPLRWLLRGCRPSRSAWYTFRDRWHERDAFWNSQALQQAIAAGLTPAQRAALDGTLVAAQASRHRLVKEETLSRRQAEREEASAADQRDKPLAVVPGWMAKTPRGRAGQRARYRQAAQRMEQRQGRNARQRASKRKARDKIVLSPSEPEAALGRDKSHV